MFLYNYLHENLRQNSTKNTTSHCADSGSARRRTLHESRCQIFAKTKSMRFLFSFCNAKKIDLNLIKKISTFIMNSNKITSVFNLRNVVLVCIARRDLCKLNEILLKNLKFIDPSIMDMMFDPAICYDDASRIFLKVAAKKKIILTMDTFCNYLLKLHGESDRKIFVRKLNTFFTHHDVEINGDFYNSIWFGRWSEYVATMFVFIMYVRTFTKTKSKLKQSFSCCDVYTKKNAMQSFSFCDVFPYRLIENICGNPIARAPVMHILFKIALQPVASFATPLFEIQKHPNIHNAIIDAFEAENVRKITNCQNAENVMMIQKIYHEHVFGTKKFKIQFHFRSGYSLFNNCAVAFDAANTTTPMMTNQYDASQPQTPLPNRKRHHSLPSKNQMQMQKRHCARKIIFS